MTVRKTEGRNVIASREGKPDEMPGERERDVPRLLRLDFGLENGGSNFGLSPKQLVLLIDSDETFLAGTFSSTPTCQVPEWSAFFKT